MDISVTHAHINTDSSHIKMEIERAKYSPMVDSFKTLVKLIKNIKCPKDFELVVRHTVAKSYLLQGEEEIKIKDDEEPEENLDVIRCPDHVRDILIAFIKFRSVFPDVVSIDINLFEKNRITIYPGRANEAIIYYEGNYQDFNNYMKEDESFFKFTENYFYDTHFEYGD
ncbi:MAG: hypothetical protein LWX56_07955 [Ignavibacteria bacterium]|nr:hypothetical protein [Ignavibacteria bacterium]